MGRKHVCGGVSIRLSCMLHPLQMYNIHKYIIIIMLKILIDYHANTILNLIKIESNYFYVLLYITSVSWEEWTFTC